MASFLNFPSLNVGHSIVQGDCGAIRTCGELGCDFFPDDGLRKDQNM